MKSLFVAVAAAAALAVWSSNGRTETHLPGPTADASPAVHLIFDL